MNPAFIRAQEVASLPGVRAGLLVEAVSLAIRKLAKRQNGLTRDMYASFNYVTESKVHFSLNLNGEPQGLFRFSYNPDEFAPPRLRRLSAKDGAPEAPDERTRALEKIFAEQLAKAQKGLWGTIKV